MWNPFKRNTVNDGEFLINQAAQVLLLDRMVARIGQDGLTNAVAGIGTSRDKRTYSSFETVRPMNRAELEAMWASNWLSKRIVTVPVQDALAEWLSVQWDSKETKTRAIREEQSGRQQQVYEWEKRFDVRLKFQEGAEWGNLYGGSLMVIGIKGEKDLSKPLNFQALGKGCLSYLHVVDRYRVGASDLMDGPGDLESPNFGRPRYYTMASNVVGSGGLIHWSRTIPFHGVKLPWFPWLSNGMWHYSTLQHVMDDVKDYGAVMSLLATMFFEANVDVLAIAGLAKQLAAPNGEAKIKKRFQDAATLKAVSRMLIIDAEDKYEKRSTSFQGLSTLVDQFVSNVAGAADTPRTRLFGEQAAGLGSEGKGDQKNYTKRLRSDQVMRYTSPAEYLYTLAAIDMFGEVPPGWKLTWNPLEQETAVEKSQRELNNANRDKTYVEAEIISPKVLAKQLKEDDVYTMMEDEDVEEIVEVGEAGDPEESAALLAMGGNLGGSSPVAKGSPIALPQDVVKAVVRVDEARAALGLPPLGGAEGSMSVAELQAKQGGGTAPSAPGKKGPPGDEKTPPFEEKTPAPEDKKAPPMKAGEDEDPDAEDDEEEEPAEDEEEPAEDEEEPAEDEEEDTEEESGDDEEEAPEAKK